MSFELFDLIAAGTELPISLPAACRHPMLCVDGRPLALPSIYRHARRGVAGIVLETADIAGRVVTTEAAVGRFVLAVAEAREGHRRRPVASETPRRQSAAAARAHEAAMAQLAGAGLVAGGRGGAMNTHLDHRGDRLCLDDFDADLLDTLCALRRAAHQRGSVVLPRASRAAAALKLGARLGIFVVAIGPTVDRLTGRNVAPIPKGARGPTTRTRTPRSSRCRTARRTGSGPATWPTGRCGCW